MLGRTIEIDEVTEAHRDYFYKAFGTHRFFRNLAIEMWSKQYQAYLKDKRKPKPDFAWLSREINKVKDERWPWVRDVSCYVITCALWDVKDAYSRFFSCQNDYPQFLKKGRKERFGISNDDIRIKDPRTILIGKLKTPIKLKEDIKIAKEDILSARIFLKAGRFFISLNFEKDRKKKKSSLIKGLRDRVFRSVRQIAKAKLRVVGLDLGLKTLAALSTGEMVPNIRPLLQLEKEIKRVQRRLSKFQRQHKSEFFKAHKKHGDDFVPRLHAPNKTRNHLKWERRFQRLHFRVANVRKDYIHKFTTKIVRRYDIICIERLRVKNLLKNHKLAKSLSDAAFGEIVRQLKYKAKLYGKIVIEVDPFFPSSKKCRICGFKKSDLTLSNRVFKCENPDCGHEEHRDTHSSRNVIPEALHQFIMRKLSANALEEELAA